MHLPEALTNLRYLHYRWPMFKARLRGVICLFKGHDVAVRYGGSGRAKARVMLPKKGRMLPRCHRCWRPAEDPSER